MKIELDVVDILSAFGFDIVYEENVEVQVKDWTEYKNYVTIYYDGENLYSEEVKWNSTVQQHCSKWAVSKLLGVKK